MKQLIQLQAHFSTLLSSPNQTAVFVSPMEKDKQRCAHPSADRSGSTDVLKAHAAQHDAGRAVSFLHSMVATSFVST